MSESRQEGSMELAIYSQPDHRPPQARDRFWIAPKGLGIHQAFEQRISHVYRTREGARRALVMKQDQQVRLATQDDPRGEADR